MRRNSVALPHRHRIQEVADQIHLEDSRRRRVGTQSLVLVDPTLLAGELRIVTLSIVVVVGMCFGVVAAGSVVGTAVAG